MSSPAPFSVVYFQLVEVAGNSRTRYLARYVGPARGPAVQIELFAEPAFMALDLEAVDLHVLPTWTEGIEPPEWLKELLTPNAWSWRDLPPRIVEERSEWEALKEEFRVPNDEWVCDDGPVD